MSEDRKTPDDADLAGAWLQAAKRADRPALGHEVVAAYLDGTLAPEERAAVEARLAADPEGLDLLLAARAALAETPPPAPESLVRRASALTRDAPSGGGALAWLFGPLGWSGAMAAVIVAGFVGFELGRVSMTGGTPGDAVLAQVLDLDEELELDLAAALSLADEDFL